MPSTPNKDFLSIILILVGTLALFTLIEIIIPLRLHGFWAGLRIGVTWISMALFGIWLLLAIPASLRGLGLLMCRPPVIPRALILLLLGLLPILLLCASCATRNADCSWHNILPLPAEQIPIRDRLRKDVEVLANNIGPRNVRTSYTNLCRAADFIESRLQESGYAVRRDTYQPIRPGLGPCSSLEVELLGTSRPNAIIIIGAHYDTVPATPGADDNASAIAVLLALAHAFANQPAACTIRFVAFPNEEPPCFWSADMGSLVYAKGCSNRNEHITAMLCLEMVGCYSEKPHSQRYPSRIFEYVFPTTGHFVGVVGNSKSSRLAADTSASLRAGGVPTQSAALSAWVTGVGWSDHWSFWQIGVPAVMITDTAHFRNPRYHTENDTPDTLDYDRMAALAIVLENTIHKLAE